jgi:sugar phosphate isomerase/epimerase
MKIGIKTYHYKPELEYFRGKIDFWEIMALHKEDYRPFTEFDIPIVVHNPHEVLGANNTDILNYNKNLEALNYSRSLADMFFSDKIIVHPGRIYNLDFKRYNPETSIRLFLEANDKRILVENMPGEDYICSSPKSTELFMKTTGAGLCFDVNHAVHFAEEINEDYKVISGEFIFLNPRHFHLGGQKFGGKSHLSFLDSDLDLNEILYSYPRNASISLEVSKDFEKTKKDLEIIREVTKRF